ncbi:hypothetical protein [Dactylosporangium sp. NPDC005555]
MMTTARGDKTVTVWRLTAAQPHSATRARPASIARVISAWIEC